MKVIKSNVSELRQELTLQRVTAEDLKAEAESARGLRRMRSKKARLI